MESLNDDCLVCLFQLLTLRDQLMVAQVCQRFRSVLQQYFWASRYKTAVLNFYEVNLSVNEFRAFVECIFPLAECIRLKELSELHYDVLKECTFSQVSDFRFSQKRPFYMDDEDLFIISKVFPSLVTFSPQGRFTGLHLERFTKLEHLTLTYCQGLQVPDFRHAIRVLNLRTLRLNTFHGKVPPLGAELECFYRLEMLLLNEFELAWLYEADRPAEFACLRELVVADILGPTQLYRLFQLFCMIRGGNLISMEFANTHCVPQLIKKLEFSCYRQLTVLSFVNAIDILDVALFKNISKCFPLLRQLHFHSCLIKKDGDLLRLFELPLDLLNIEECSTRFQKLTIEIAEIVRKRTTPVTLNFFNNFYRSNYQVVLLPVCLEVRGTQNPLFKVTQVRSSCVNYEPIRVLFA